jgi:anti-anti-sigma regulatory factor
MPECHISREPDGERIVYRLSGMFDRGGAWALREHLEREPARDVLLDFSQVRDFSDLGVAVLAHGLTSGARRVAFRGLRTHQLRIFRYCGVPVDELAARDASAAMAAAAPGGAPRFPLG